ncbi:hypothetical protein [Lysobacter gummosus]|uniref:hypothetical protein n=1 Tax=Lysobacter gummosus TaxID=262324 RepID=UPI003626DC2F
MFGPVRRVRTGQRLRQASPADVSPQAAVVSVQSVADITLLRPSDIVIEYRDQVARIPRGQTARYAIAVINNSSFALQSSGSHRAYVTYRWLTGNGQEHSLQNPHIPLRTAIAPGQRSVAEFDVVAPDKSGKYLLKVIMGIDDGPDLESGGQAPLHYNVTVD